MVERKVGVLRITGFTRRDQSSGFPENRFINEHDVLVFWGWIEEIAHCVL
jgi:hypothetical protein